jgi:hypothetical protein
MVNVEGGGCAMTGRIVSPSTIGTMNDEPLQIVWSVLNQDQFSLSSLTSKASLRLTFLTCNPDHSNNLYSIIQPATSTLRDLSFAKDGESKAKSEDAGEEKWELNGKNKDRDERRGGRNDRNDRNDRFQDRRGGGRGRGRGRGGFNNNRKYVAHVLNLTNITDSFRQAQRGI